jgi:beta-glucosidase
VKKFPDGFLWGVSTSAYQVEGAVAEDGRGSSIWDVFSHTPGKIDGGGTGDVACDHYHRWRSDVDLIASLNLNAYRFSLAWPRIFPDGDGRVERRGLDHYDRLIDRLLELHIAPIVTLYHWDLPQPLEDRGGWLNRATVERFAEYARTCYETYGDRVRWWLTVNEPWIIGLLGYLHGLHAPGMKNDVRGEVTAFHHTLLAHGRAVQELRTFGGDANVGAALCLAPHYPATHDPADADAARASDGYVNRWFLDPVLKGSYPDDVRALYEGIVGELDFVRDGDLATIATPSDYLGVNYYSRRLVRAAPHRRPFPWDVVVAGDVPLTEGGTDGVPRTEAGTEIVPAAFTDLLVRLRDDYGEIPLLITENGSVFGDAPASDGRVHDERRVQFIHDHLAALHDALEQGVPVIGYCHWSFMDNFEWALGYAQRFGLVYVDYGTLERTVKDSGRYYAEVARANALLTPP